MITAKHIERQLFELHYKHGTNPRPLQRVARAPAVTHPVTLSGFASTTDVDNDRVKFSPFAFGTTLPTDLPLYLEHEQQIGVVDHLQYDVHGQLLATVTTEHPVASRRNAFSISGRARGFALFSLAHIGLRFDS